MDETTAWSVLAPERRAFADVLETLTEDQWRHPTLCGEWNVAEVATHMMVGPTGSLFGFMTAMARGRGNFDRANQVMVQRRMSRPRQAIIDDFRTHAEHRFRPPGFDWHAPMTDFALHRQDIVVPLGLPDETSSDRQQAWPEVLGFLRTPKAASAFGTQGLPPLSYAATDVEWSEGEGPRVEGPARALATVLTGRPALVGDLSGPGAPTLADWVRG